MALWSRLADVDLFHKKLELACNNGRHIGQVVDDVRLNTNISYDLAQRLFGCWATRGTLIKRLRPAGDDV